MPPPAAAAANAATPVAATEATDVSPKKPPMGKKKLLLAALVAVLLAAGGVATLIVLKKRAAAHAEAEGEAPAAAEKIEAKSEKFDPKAVPTFVALDTFTVNLADKEAERYAQIGVTLEVVDAKAVDLIKNYMPAIRSNILLVLAQKTSKELLEREGKQVLAAEIVREAVRPLGYDLSKPLASDDTPPPVRKVHFSNFIIQ
jgi:flagellar protein FliL